MFLDPENVTSTTLLVVIKFITFGTHFPEVDDMFLTSLVMVGQ